MFTQHVHADYGLLIVHENRFFFRAPVYRAGAYLSVELDDPGRADVFLTLLELSGQADARDLLNHVSVRLLNDQPEEARKLLDRVEVSPHLAARYVILRVLTDREVDSRARFR